MAHLNVKIHTSDGTMIEGAFTGTLEQCTKDAVKYTNEQLEWLFDGIYITKVEMTWYPTPR